MYFFPEYQTFLVRPRIVPRAPGCGARRGPVCTPRCKCRSRPGSVARALVVQSRASWQIIVGLISASSSLAGQCKPHNLLFCFAAAAAVSCLYHTVSLKPSSSLLCGSHGTTAIAHQALPFVKATDGAPVCVCAAMFPVGLPVGERE